MKDEPIAPEKPRASNRCLDIKAAAEYLGVSADTVLRLINTGVLPIVKFPVQRTSRGVDPHGTSRRVLIDVRDLDDLIEHNKETRGAPLSLASSRRG